MESGKWSHISVITEYSATQVVNLIYSAISVVCVVRCVSVFFCFVSCLFVFLCGDRRKRANIQIIIISYNTGFLNF